jgi:hypothetical protein
VNGIRGLCAGVVLLALVLLGAIAPSARATEAPPDPGAREVSLYFPSPANHRNVVHLQLFPGKGVAVVDTYEGGEDLFKSGRGVAYAIAVPPARFDGSLHLKFPGLGVFAGTVTPENARGSAAQAKRCRSSYPIEGGTFEGHLAFRGAGGYGSWKATRAPVGILLACAGEPKKDNGTDALFGQVDELGPSLIGPAPIQFVAQGAVGHRYVEFIVWAGHSGIGVEFNAIDREWLRGGVATERWVKKAPASRKETLALGPDSTELDGPTGPASATFTPPAPFFGNGTYRRSTGKLTGSLGVSFLGLKLHLTPSPLTAAIADEDLD